MQTFGGAWLMMGVALGFHVIDEAATDFLASYNPIATRTQPTPLPESECRSARLSASVYLRLGQLGWNRSTSVLPAAEWLAATTGFPPTR
jgi:hypothetical protein